MLLLMLAVAGTAEASGPSADGSPSADGVPEPRLVLALFDGSREAKVRWTRLHRFAEMVLNHLGFHVVYHDLSGGLPPQLLEPDYAAVLTWFDAPVRDSGSYVEWAATVERQSATDPPLRFLVLGESGLARVDFKRPAANAFLARLGVTMQPQPHHFGVWGRVGASDPALLGFEQDFAIADARFPLVQARADAVTHLRLSEPEGAGGTGTDLVVTSSTGAFVHESALLRYDADARTSLWILNPFAFFERTLGGGARPIPDTTTRNGRRLFFAVVNGEGWTTPVPTDRPGDAVRLAGSVVLEHLLEPFPDLPLTLSLVTGDFDPVLGGLFAREGRDIAAAALRLPHVSPASRTRTMPLRWSFFERYSRAEEMAAMERFVNPAPIRERGLVPAAFSNLSEVFLKDKGRLNKERGTALRRYVGEPFALESEIAGSLREVAALAGNDEPVELISWGGDAQVFEAALAQARASGATALGGQGGVYDSAAPSVTNLSALSAQVGEQRQIYDALQGDAAFTNYWTAPIHGLLRLGQVAEATERPRRLKPLQIGFTAYSALRYGSLNAVRTQLEEARSAELAPVPAADYARTVEGFFSVRLFRIGPLQWRVDNRGALQTLRFDTAAGRLDLDPGRCSGVLGRRSANGSLYVALDPAAESPVVALRAASDAEGAEQHLAGFLLDHARWHISGLEADACSARFEVHGHGVGEMLWQVPAPGSYRVEMFGDAAEGADKRFYWDDALAGEDHRLSLALPALDRRAVRVQLSACR
ncbi:MAG: hypothetical protein K9M02_15665 [Thiohalocapsa sp.]|nr:hypothetical protein [Thiohalocapsa sp.]